jgi:hypothetical protein
MYAKLADDGCCTCEGAAALALAATHCDRAPEGLRWLRCAMEGSVGGSSGRTPTGGRGGLLEAVERKMQESTTTTSPTTT